MRLASRFGYANQIRRDRPLTREELMQVVPSVFGEEKHTSRSENYAYITTIVTNGAIVIHTQRLKSDPGGNLLS